MLYEVITLVFYTVKNEIDAKVFAAVAQGISAAAGYDTHLDADLLQHADSHRNNFV